MTISGWIIFGVFVLIIILGAGIATNDFDCKPTRVFIVVALLVASIYGGFRWYFTNTASGQRALVNQRSELNNGLERTINIYTADGEMLATYTGKIDIENKDGGYLLFDYNGKRYTYYNCFVESIADIE